MRHPAYGWLKRHLRSSSEVQQFPRERIIKSAMQSGWNEQLTAQSHDTQPNPIVRIENGVVQIGAPRLAQEAAPNAPFWRGALLMTAFVIALGGVLAGIVLTRPSPANGAGAMSLTPTPAPSATPSPTATPQPALPTVTQSWGQNAAAALISMQIDAT